MVKLPTIPISSTDWAPYALALGSITCSSGAQLLLKLLMRQHALGIGLLRQPLFYAGFGLFGLSALLWLRVLSRLPLSTAYPLVGLQFVLIAIGSAAWLHERVSWIGIVGLILIVSGIALVAQG